MPEQGSKRDILLVICAAFFFSSSFMMVQPIITGFAENLGATSMLMGLIGGLSNVVSLVLRPFVGSMTDRFSKFRISLASTGLIFLASVGYLCSMHPVMVAVSRILAGFGYIGYTACMGTWIAEMAPNNKIGSYMGLFGVALASAMGTAPATGVAIYQYFGYRPAFLAVTLYTISVALLIRLVKNPGTPNVPDTVQPAQQKFQPIAWNVLPITVVATLSATPFFATQVFLVRYCEARSIPVMAGLFFPIYSVILIALRLTLKHLFDTVPFKRFLCWCTASAFIGFTCFSFMTDYLLLGIAAIFTAAGFGLMFSVAQANAIIIAGPGRRGIGNSTFFIGNDLGMALGPIVGGILYGHLPIAWFFPTLLIFPLITLPFWWISQKIWH